MKPKVEFETKRDRGDFTAKEAASPSDANGSTSMESKSSPGIPAQHTILIIDDETLILSALKKSLACEAYQIVTVSDPQEALGLISTNRFSVIMSDYSMPGMSGADLLAFAMEKDPRCIRIMLTGATVAEEVPDQVADSILYCQRFIKKPWDDEQLRQTIRECILQYEASEQ